jgi:CRISPR/Cas system-associated protein Cas10 (large subunit of type III CRISPR-Cas system)
MPITITQLRNRIASRRVKLPGVQRCAVCKVPLQETLTGNRITDKGHVCSDCYFRAMSDELEKHPIVMPRTVRGIC